MPKRDLHIHRFRKVCPINCQQHEQLRSLYDITPDGYATPRWHGAIGSKSHDAEMWACHTLEESLAPVPLDEIVAAGAGVLPAVVKFRPKLFLWQPRHTLLLDRLRYAISEVRPYRSPFGVVFGQHFWTLTDTERFCDDDQLRLVFLDTVDKDRRKFEKLKLRHSGLSGAPIKSRREAIPEEVRMYVWRRDQGRCVKCGSAERLEFDHIITHSRGGSDTERNIQLLCESCNRAKSDDI